MAMEKFDDDALEQVARYFAALAVPMRLKILNALRGGERNVGELTEQTGCTQANVSKHLAVLAQNGLVQKAARGTSAYYSIADPSTYELCDVVCGQIGRRYAGQATLHRMFSTAPATKAKGKRQK
ncbi:MAG TPA: metalloregulator ArsR/SmtB family transcription factor [Burkholderiales bacterium]|nr:metalloregulator ArsR/SmtB family transcription factor [Burkholderiales bacterium]